MISLDPTTGSRHVVVMGDALLDVDVDGWVERICPDAPAPVLDDPVERPRPGGAALAAVLLAAEKGCVVTLVTALAPDRPGRRLRTLLEASGVVVVDLGLVGITPEKVRVRASGQSMVRIDKGGRFGGAIGRWSSDAATSLAAADAVLVSDYGRGFTATPDVQAAVAAVADVVPVVWDPHPRGVEPLRGVALVTPNRSEAERWSPGRRDGRVFAEGSPTSAPLTQAAGNAQSLVERWQAGAVVVTLGSGGAVVARRGSEYPSVVNAISFDAPDACGAGDRFAGAAALAMARGDSAVDAVKQAVVAASAFVGAGGAAGWAVPKEISPSFKSTPAPTGSAAHDVVARVRATGGTVVATGGCFDLLHAGHVRVLEAARELGDCLIVCLNSDDSVRRLKGADRPVVSERDRAAVLGALGAVDVVIVFDEDTPGPVLDELRPDIFAKGGDYDGRRIPEADVLDRWGGTCVTLPYLEGRSTSLLVKEVLSRGNN